MQSVPLFKICSTSDNVQHTYNSDIRYSYKGQTVAYFHLMSQEALSVHTFYATVKVGSDTNKRGGTVNIRFCSACIYPHNFF